MIGVFRECGIEAIVSDITRELPPHVLFALQAERAKIGLTFCIDIEASIQLLRREKYTLILLSENVFKVFS